MLSGLGLVSPALDWDQLQFGPSSSSAFLSFFPTFAATAQYHQKAKTTSLKSTEEFAEKVLAPFLLTHQSPSYPALIKAIALRLGLAEGLVEHHEGRISDEVFALNLLAPKMVGRLDARMQGQGDYPRKSEHVDPSFYEPMGAYAALMPENPVLGSYAVFSIEVNEKWKFREDKPGPVRTAEASVVPNLRRALAQNASLKVFFMSGRYDLAVPYHGIELQKRMLGREESIQSRVFHNVYEAGHMMYLNPKERINMVKDLKRLILD